MPEISVIVPVYNAEKYLDDCISSILEQSFQDYEVILLPGESTDNSTRLCEDWTRKDSRIRLVTQDKNCVAYARNKGIASSQGKYFCFCDADDLFMPSFLEDMHSLIDENSLDIVECGFYRATSDLSAREEYKVTDYISSFDHDLYERFGAVSIWKCMIRTDYWEEYGFSFPESNQGEDLSIYSLIFSCTEKTGFLDKPLYIYRSSPSSLSETTKHETSKQLQIFQSLYEFSISELKRVDTYNKKRLTLISQMEHYSADSLRIHEGLTDSYNAAIKNLTSVANTVYGLRPLGWGSTVTGILCQMLAKAPGVTNTYIKDMSLTALTDNDMKSQFSEILINSNTNLFLVDFLPELDVLDSSSIEGSFERFKSGFSVLLGLIRSLKNVPLIILTESVLIQGNLSPDTHALRQEYLKLLFTYVSLVCPEIKIIKLPEHPDAASLSVKELTTYFHEQVVDIIHSL